MIPTRPKKSRSEVVEPPVEAVRTHVGLQTILEWAGKESGIDEDLKTCFEIGDAQKLSSIARYWVATDGDTLPRMETWQMMNPLPYEYPITQDVYGKLFASVGRNESGVQAYWKLEEKLLAWLDQHSLIQILDWFRCVDYVAATGNDSASKWTTGTTKRDQLFLKLLGVSKSWPH